MLHCHCEGLERPKQSHKILKKNDFRVYPTTHDELVFKGTEFENEEQKKLRVGNYIGEKWGGIYLRAPDIFSTVLERGKHKFIKLNQLANANVRRGITTGCNEFFCGSYSPNKAMSNPMSTMTPADR